MKGLIALFILIISLTATGQSQMGTSFKSGFNRIGLYFDQTLNFDIDNHQVDFGIRYYGPDFVFERNNIGMSIGYGYNFYSKNDQFYFGPSFSGSFFRENKTSTEFYLSDFIVQNKIGWNMGLRWSLFSNIGFGVVVNKINSYYSGGTQTFAYFNYEFSVGIKYNWKSRFEIKKDRDDLE